MKNTPTNEESLFTTLVGFAEESVIDIAQFAGAEVKDLAGSVSSAPPTQMSDAEYFANAVNGDSKQYPPKDQAMAELIAERQASENIDAQLREASGGSVELSGEDLEAQMQDRMQSYLAAQQQLRM